MTNVLMTSVHSATRNASRLLRGETVVLKDPAAGTLATITDAVVTLDPVSVTRGDGPADRTGVIRLQAAHHANAVASHTCLVRGESWSVLSVGDVHADSFRVEISTTDQDHTNLFDINDTQAVWSPDA